MFTAIFIITPKEFICLKIMDECNSESSDTGERDWESCYICQHDTSEKLLHPTTSVKLKNKPDKLYMCFQEVIGNIKKLYDLDQLPGFVYVMDTIGTSGNSYDIENVISIMMSTRSYPQ